MSKQVDARGHTDGPDASGFKAKHLLADMDRDRSCRSWRCSMRSKMVRWRGLNLHESVRSHPVTIILNRTKRLSCVQALTESDAPAEVTGVLLALAAFGAACRSDCLWCKRHRWEEIEMSTSFVSLSSLTEKAAAVPRHKVRNPSTSLAEHLRDRELSCNLCFTLLDTYRTQSPTDASWHPCKGRQPGLDERTCGPSQPFCTQPPSTFNTWPVTLTARHRYKAACAMSSTVWGLCSGTLASSFSCIQVA